MRQVIETRNVARAFDVTKMAANAVDICCEKLCCFDDNFLALNVQHDESHRQRIEGYIGSLLETAGSDRFQRSRIGQSVPRPNLGADLGAVFATGEHELRGAGAESSVHLLANAGFTGPRP